MYDDEKWMRLALEEAHIALQEGEIPIGAVIIKNNRLIARGHNMTETLHDPTAHAEMIAITSATQNIGKYLQGCSLYVTVEPCVMCAGAIRWSQFSRVVFGTKDIKRGYSTYIPKPLSPFQPKTIVKAGILENECRSIITEFFRKKRRIF